MNKKLVGLIATAIFWPAARHQMTASRAIVAVSSRQQSSVRFPIKHKLQELQLGTRFNKESLLPAHSTN